jgi:hypothetical protein
MAYSRAIYCKQNLLIYPYPVKGKNSVENIGIFDTKQDFVN